MWINSIECQNCPKRSYNGLNLTLYNLHASYAGKLVTCDDNYCVNINDGIYNSCKALSMGTSCSYGLTYGDESGSYGYYVKDVQYHSVLGDFKSMLANESLIFGCGTIATGNLAFLADAFDGILGFGNSSSSIISQLASIGKVKKTFAHCLNRNNDGGIFTIGHVIQPKVNVTHLIQDMPHYSVYVTRFEVGTELLNLSTSSSRTVNNIMAIVDSGTTLAYLPELIYEHLMKKIIAGQSGTTLQILKDRYTCFKFNGSVNDGFPAFTLYFENSLFMKEDFFCFGWQKNEIDDPSLKDTIILGDLILSRVSWYCMILRTRQLDGPNTIALQTSRCVTKSLDWLVHIKYHPLRVIIRVLNMYCSCYE